MDEEDDRADEKMAEAPPDPPVPGAAKKRKKKKKKPKAAYQAPVVKLDENRNKSKGHLLRQIPVYEADVALVIDTVIKGGFRATRVVVEHPEHVVMA